MKAHKFIVEHLTELADRHLQEALWTGKLAGKQSSFSEAVEGLFTDTGLDDALRSQTTGYSEPAELKLRELGEAVRAVHGHGKPAQIIADRAMELVRKFASEALALIDK